MQTIINKQTITIIILSVIALVYSSPLHALSKKPCNNGVILADDTGKILYHSNKQKQFIPASIIKILTSLAVLDTLGEEYHFKTGYYFDKTSKNLYIKGFGDPVFISEVIVEFCRQIIATSQTKIINNIIIDQSFFADQITVPGKGDSLNPYDAPVGALCANFNTIMFKKDRTGKFISAEPQTPLLDIFQKDVKAAGTRQDRIILTQKQSLLYPGQLIKYFLETDGILVYGDVKTGLLPSLNTELSFFTSPYSLDQVVQKLLQFSNNFIANQLLLTIGAEKYGVPANLEKGIKATRYYSSTRLHLHNITILEGSGLSRSNRISPEQMLKVLIGFMPHHKLLKYQDHDFFKTGTLSGIRTRAGYFLGNNGRLHPYVIMTNKQNNEHNIIRGKLLKLILRNP